MNRQGDAAPPRKRVTCPACGGPAWFDAGNPWRPFCSERCRNHDLGAWASETYRVASEAPEADDAQPPAPPARH